MAFKRIKDWETSITSFRTGDVIPVDGPSGTAKMDKDDLLARTAENALVDNLSPKFDPTKPDDEGGYAYYAGASVFYEGKNYVFVVNHRSGPWNFSEVEQKPLSSVVDFGSVGEAVNAWLDSHPEATTTVQDGSLTEAKFSDALKLKTIKDYVTPEMFGARGDGVTDDTSAVQAAANTGKLIFGSGEYKIDSVVFNGVIWIGGKIVTSGTNPIELQNNCKLIMVEVHNTRYHTISQEHRVIYVSGSNNYLSKVLFTGSVEAGLCIAVGRLTDNVFIQDCIFEPIYKIDIHCGGVNTFVDHCVFKDHTADTLSNLSVYSNALKICAYDENQEGETYNYPNGSVIKVTNCDMGSHGDNPIDCYTGAVDVIIDNNTIRSINTDCIEIKSSAGEVAAQETHSYRITNNHLSGYGIIVLYNRTPSPYTNYLYNIIFSENECHNIPKGYGANIGRMTSCVQWSIENVVMSNNIFDCGGSSFMGGIDRDNFYNIENCYIYNCSYIFSSNSGTLKVRYNFVGCEIICARMINMRTNTSVVVQSCKVKFSDICFVSCKENTQLVITNSLFVKDSINEKYVMSIVDGLAQIYIQASRFVDTPVFTKSGSVAIPPIISIANIFETATPRWFKDDVPLLVSKAISDQNGNILAAPASYPSTGTYTMKIIDGVVQWVADS